MKKMEDKAMTTVKNLWRQILQCALFTEQFVRVTGGNVYSRHVDTAISSVSDMTSAWWLSVNFPWEIAARRRMDSSINIEESN